ncbi:MULTISPECIES: hypothetical protein [unclassified Helicobacter]|nr:MULTISPECIES: hypothetical protein [unclassified Helicobacter]
MDCFANARNDKKENPARIKKTESKKLRENLSRIKKEKAESKVKYGLLR